MDVSALHGKQLLAAVVFVAATLVLAVQLITPSPVMVSVGESGTQTTQLGQYFTTIDVGLIAVAATLLGASGSYLLVDDASGSTTTEPAPRRDSASEVVGHSNGREPRQAPMMSVDADGGSDQTIDPRAAWEETLDRLQKNEETVYSVVMEAGGELPQRDVVEQTELSKATVSRTLDTLESKQLLERKRKGMGNVIVLQ